MQVWRGPRGRGGTSGLLSPNAGFITVCVLAHIDQVEPMTAEPTPDFSPLSVETHCMSRVAIQDRRFGIPLLGIAWR
jgi:hypothetical protein